MESMSRLEIIETLYKRLKRLLAEQRPDETFRFEDAIFARCRTTDIERRANARVTAQFKETLNELLKLAPITFAYRLHIVRETCVAINWGTLSEYVLSEVAIRPEAREWGIFDESKVEELEFTAIKGYLDEPATEIVQWWRNVFRQPIITSGPPACCLFEVAWQLHNMFPKRDDLYGTLLKQYPGEVYPFQELLEPFIFDDRWPYEWLERYGHHEEVDALNKAVNILRPYFPH